MDVTRDNPGLSPARLTGPRTGDSAAGPTRPPVSPAPAGGPAPTPVTTPPPDLSGRTGSGAAPSRAPAVVRAPGPRRARLLLTRLDPWSVMKTYFMISIAAAIMLLVATAVLWWTLDVTGVFTAVNRGVDDVAGTSTSTFDFLSLVSFGRVMGIALLLAAVEVVLVSALATLFAFLYNLSVGFTGGLEVTLTEDN